MNEDLAARLERLETAEAARDVVYRYASGLDARDWEQIAASLAADAVLIDPTGSIVGRAAIVSSLQAAMASGFIPCHQVTSTRVDLAGPGRAVVESTIHYTLQGGGADGVGWGTYRDEVQVTDGVGRIVRKEFTPAAHVAGSIAELTERVAVLETGEAAREASWRYATAIDTLDFDLLASAFAEDATLTTRRGSQHGRDAIIEYYRTALADPVDRRHFLVNQRVTVLAPGSARLDSYFLYTFAGADTSILGWGAYVDHVCVVDGKGVITSKEISIGAHADVRAGWATGVGT